MERSASTATKENDVTSPAEETLQFDDNNLRGENLKYYLLSVIKYKINEEGIALGLIDTNV